MYGATPAGNDIENIEQAELKSLNNSNNYKRKISKGEKNGTINITKCRRKCCLSGKSL